MNKDYFSDYHPITDLIFFAGVLIYAMVLLHPVFSAASLVCSYIYYFGVKGIKGLKYLCGMTIVFVFLSCINPIFNTAGSIRLFYIFARPYTLEALIYGITLSAVIVAVLCWFAVFNTVMGSEKIIYLLSQITPAISIVLSMILRLIPNMKRKAAEIIQARACIGLAGPVSSKAQRLKAGADVFNTLAAWSLESAVIMSDSMKARGYGSAKRTDFRKYRITRRDIICMLFMIVMIISTAVLAAMGGAKADLSPLDIAWFGNIRMSLCLGIYILFMLIPTIINMKEAAVWHILRSRI